MILIIIVMCIITAQNSSAQIENSDFTFETPMKANRSLSNLSNTESTCSIESTSSIDVTEYTQPDESDLFGKNDICTEDNLISAYDEAYQDEDGISKGVCTPQAVTENNKVYKKRVAFANNVYDDLKRKSTSNICYAGNRNNTQSAFINATLLWHSWNPRDYRLGFEHLKIIAMTFKHPNALQAIKCLYASSIREYRYTALRIAHSLSHPHRIECTNEDPFRIKAAALFYACDLQEKRRNHFYLGIKDYTIVIRNASNSCKYNIKLNY